MDPLGNTVGMPWLARDYGALAEISKDGRLMPAIRNPDLLRAAAKNRGLVESSSGEMCYATGWRDFEMDRPQLSPWVGHGWQSLAYSRGWDDAKKLIGALEEVLEAA